MFSRANARLVSEGKSRYGVTNTFILYRILGNDLPPRHGSRQTLENLRFLLDNEPDFPDLEKRWVVNRIADGEREAELIALLDVPEGGLGEQKMMTFALEIATPQQAATELGMPVKLRVRVSGFDAVSRMVEAGLGIALLSESNAAEELKYATISTIGVRDLKASHDVVTVTRRGGFLSAAARRLMEIVRRQYSKDANGE